MKRLALLAVLALAACQTPAAQVSLDAPVPATAAAPASDPVAQVTSTIEKVRAFKIADLQNAIVVAQGGNDTIAVTCYSEILKRAQAAQLAPGGGTIGAFTILEQKRLLSQQVASLQGGSNPLVSACGALVLSEENTIAMIAAMVGGRAALGGLPLP